MICGTLQKVRRSGWTLLQPASWPLSGDCSSVSRIGLQRERCAHVKVTITWIQDKFVPQTQ